jgi:hypothetical protein
MTRLFRRSFAEAATALLVVAAVGLAAGTSHASERDDGRGDDDGRVIVSINTGPVCWEQPNPMDPCQVRVTLSHPVGVPVTVTIDTRDGTATAPADYLPLSGVRVTVPTGNVVLAVPLQVVDDGVPEPDEWFLATISATSVGSIGTGRAVVTIGDGAPAEG